VYFADPDGVILEITWPASSTRFVDRPDALHTVKLWMSKVAAPA
jgi:hypothetical protein